LTPGYNLDVSGTAHITSNTLVDGSLGINCNTPSYPLDVSGKGHITGQLQLDGDAGSSGGTGCSVLLRASTINFQLGDGVLTKEAFLGISDALQQGALLWQLGTNSTNLYCNSDPAVVTFGRIKTEYPAMSFKHPGVNLNHIGINIANPSYPLDVSGTARITSNTLVGGALGINCNTPSYPLDVNGVANINSNINVAGTSFLNNTVYCGGGGIPSGVGNVIANFRTALGANRVQILDEYTFSSPPQGGKLFFNSGNIGIVLAASDLALMTASGGANRFVGINTYSPQYPLHVASSNTITLSASGWQINPTSSASNGNFGAGQAISIYATNSIWAGNNFICTSDERVKKNIIDASSSLAIISSIKLRSYDFRDPADTRHISHGVVAQEVQAVYPEAVHKSTGLVPTILQETMVITKNADGSLLLVLGAEHGLAVNDSVLLSLKPDLDASGVVILDVSGNPTFTGENFETPVLQIPSPTSFTVAAWSRYATDPTRPLMVVGKRVNDFLSVDEDVLGLLALGGIQELASTITVQDTTISSLQGNVASQASTIQSLSSMFSTLYGLNPSLATA
jgi:hypothetical protein